MVAITGWESMTTSCCIGLRMKEVVLKTVQSMVFTSGKMMTVQDLGNDEEWEAAGIIGCSTIDMKKVWIPWDSKEPSKVQISFAMFYEKEMRVRAEAKLTETPLLKLLKFTDLAKM